MGKVREVGMRTDGRTWMGGKGNEEMEMGTWECKGRVMREQIQYVPSGLAESDRTAFSLNEMSRQKGGLTDRRTRI